jgi:hypothetical protein
MLITIDEFPRSETLFDGNRSTMSTFAIGDARASARGDRPLQQDFENRLAELVQSAITSRALARQYLRTARTFVAAARMARLSTNRSIFDAHIREACAAHKQAHRCFGFARLCQRRADCLAAIGGYR